VSEFIGAWIGALFARGAAASANPGLHTPAMTPNSQSAATCEVGIFGTIFRPITLKVPSG
jgi:hypothetical protein